MKIGLWPRASAAMASVLAGFLAFQGFTETPAKAESTRRIPASATTLENVQVADLATQCNPTAIQAIANRLPIKVSIETLPRAQIPGPFLPGGVKFVPAAGRLPAYCQISGSFETNPKTGKRANFLATLPASWNQRYLQIGCGGHCGTFAVSDAASPTIPISMQGLPGDSIARGFASFATDEGHAGFQQNTWAIKAPGQLDQDMLDDFLYRSHKVLAQMGKQFTTAFYAQGTGTARKIAYSYFCGCSGGGRDALVAASYFPEEFDGIVVGSPYANMANLSFHGAGTSLATIRSPGAAVSKDLVAKINPIVLAKCDEYDGVKDGLIQNPAACDFRPEKDLPRCANDQPGSDCFTGLQIETISTLLTAVTDREGRVVQPGYSVSEIQNDLLLPPAKPGEDQPWPDTGNPATGASGGMGLLGDSVIRVFTHKAEPGFRTASIINFGSGGRGSVTGFRVIVPAAEVARTNAAVRMGIGAIPENAARFIRQDRKMMIWVNLSDNLLSPYMSINYYKQLARMYGGYEKLQRNIRMFALAGTAHCTAGGIGKGPSSFDALGAMQAWVERGTAPNAMEATLFEGTPFGANYSKPAGRTIPLCKFPEMARYSGKGDVNDGANWSCPQGDTRMLKVGESGRQAGVSQ